MEHLLGILAEECAEVAQRCSKAQRFGVHQKQADQPHTNAERITFELNDVYAAVEMIRDEIGLMSQFGLHMPAMVSAKIAKVEKYLKRSDDLGALDREYASTGNT